MAAKRWLDVIVASGGLIVLLPVLGVLGSCVLLTMGRPVFFRQMRIGRHGKPFTVIKVRTMLPRDHGSGAGDGDASRLTRFGRLLRSWSLDELPSLWNVLKGEMSLVGPRPLLPQYLPLYSPRQARRHEVRPGITGWAQVNGRNAVDWATRLEMDVWYVENRSFLLDLKILGMTAIKVLRREGINQPGNATMEPFTGQGANG